jgi:hypothetical protein
VGGGCRAGRRGASSAVLLLLLLLRLLLLRLLLLWGRVELEVVRLPLQLLQQLPARFLVP